ncbi:hypothetical protein [Flavobacterium columnare]|uniref:Uncharacterized protein n=2 Tax=Flavobacterium TaxID=237 RepID=A0A2N9PAU5_9FLAO|nr:hypothetical protein [Flavobacterium columnare]RVU89640.1 hypothetical protein EH230_12740 [Flavobacterium columnare]SPE77455.1 hypothetical protein FLACOL_01448 [Flavobacterium columnare]
MKFAYLIFVLSFLLRPVVPVFSYIINYDYVSTVLCENKNKPELKCNGKCYLKKQMAKTSEEEKPLQKNTKQIKLEQELLFFYPNLNGLTLLNPTFSFKTTTTLYINLYYFLEENFIFHPPSFKNDVQYNAHF